MNDETLYQFKKEDINALRLVIRQVDASQFRKLVTDELKAELSEETKDVLVTLLSKVDVHIEHLQSEEKEYVDLPEFKDGVLTAKFHVSEV